MTSRYKDKRPGQPEIIINQLTGEFLNYRQIWLLSFILTSLFALVPVIFFALIDYNLTQSSLEQDAQARTARLASNTWRTISFFLDERRNALKYVANAYDRETLKQTDVLAGILVELRESFGGFSDIGIINADGFQETYAGPYNLLGKNYKDQLWFMETMQKGSSVSDVFLGYRMVPHISIAIRQQAQDHTYFILRATCEHALPRIFSHLETTHGGDIFLVNDQGVLQTPSRYFGDILTPISITLPPKTNETMTFTFNHKDEALVAAYRYIPNTPLVLMVVKSQKGLMAPWHESRLKLLRYLGVSIAFILIWIWAVTTYLIQRLKTVDRKRVKYYHLAEYANKMASIGRLAAGVAHEINNPLAIINEKAGLIQDMARFKPEYQEDERLNGALNVILESVKRCSRITRQLLSFGRQTQAVPVPLSPSKVLDEVLIFLSKEAELRKITVDINIPKHLPKVLCDHGKLQQVMLNIINNAFSAMSQKGTLTITAEKYSDRHIAMSFKDTGCGISQENLEEVFEPFFSTKTEKGGTGLGLSITYGLIQEMGGRIEVNSQINSGTTFTIYLPTTQAGRNTI